MKRDWNITDGTAQDDRFPEPLDDRASCFFRVDERTFEDMVSRTADFAKAIRFYNLRDQIDGNWINLFYADEAVVMAEIIATDYTLMETEFIGHGKTSPLEAAGYVVRFAERFDSWYKRLSQSEDELSQVLCRAINDRKLRATIADVRQVLTYLERENPAVSQQGLRRLATFHEHWKGREFEIQVTETPAETEDRDTGDRRLKSKLNSAFYTFVHSVDSLKPIARRSLAHSLKNKKHDPSMALFMAFGKLFDQARDKLNLFTARHRDFYYKNVLGMTPKPETPDATCLVFQAEAGATSLTIPQGTEFSAGKTDGEVELIYKSDAELNVTDARVLDLRTLCCSRDPLVSPAYQLQYANALWALHLGNAAADAPASASAAISWPLFGAKKPGVNVSPGEEATIGFAVASSALLLREGSREITVSIAFRVPGVQDLTWEKVDPLSLTVNRVLRSTDLNAQEAAAWIWAQMKSHLESNPDAPPEVSKCLERIGDGQILIENPDLSPRGLLQDESPVAASTAVSPDEASRVDLGRRFRYVILNHNGLPADVLADFRKRVALAFSDENKNDLLVQDPLYMFHRVFGAAFRVDITTASGWHTVPTYSVSMQSPPDGTSDTSFELEFTLELDTGAPAVAGCDPNIHGQGFGTALPVLRFCLNPGAIVYPYSILQDLAVQTIAVRSDVSDATRIVAWNQQGQLDPSKPFNPFGPLPTTNSYLILGNFDSAKMSLTSLRLRLEWGELPDVDLAEYYAAYGDAYGNDKFVVTQSALRDGRWVPARPEGRPSTLFRTDGTKPASENVIEINAVRYLKPIDPRLGEEQFEYGRDARDGFFRLSLAGPAGAFGHAEYPALLSGVLSENAAASRWKRHDPGKLPNPPYTPIINRMSLSYTAESAIGGAARAASTPDAFCEQVYTIHPFGMKPVDTNKEWPLLPRLEFDGSLFIGFDAAEAGGGLTLLFHLCEASATSIAPEPEPVFWHYLASDQWRPLAESQVLSDTTEGFLSSGIVTLDLPDDITTDNSVMPGNIYWLRVSAQRNLQSFCRLYGVWTQAVRVTRCLAEKAPVSAKPLPAGSIRVPVKSIPGLRSVSQPIASTEGRAAETQRQMIERTSERLRHKYRASTPWDYERIILAQFPEVFKVKCFPALSSSVGDRIAPVPGSVLIVVMPRPDEYNIFAPMMDAVHLMRIQDFLRDKISPFAQVEVRNPAYERIQVVCKIRLTDAARGQRGRYLSLLNQDIVAWFSPWKNGFGWSFSENQVKAHIRDLPYIEDVTGFSMLHITQNEQDETYRLSDTARAPFTDQVSPRYPWSLAIASPVHDIQLADKPAGDVPSITGIGQMRIGNTFITVK